MNEAEVLWVLRVHWVLPGPSGRRVDLASSSGLNCGVMMVLRDHHRVHAGPVHGSAVLEGGGGLDVLVVVSWLASRGHEAVLRLVMIVTCDLVKSVRVGRGSLRGRHWPIHGDTKTITITT